MKKSIYIQYLRLGFFKELKTEIVADEGIQLWLMKDLSKE